MANAIAAEIHPAITRTLRLAAATHPVAAAGAGRALERVLGAVADAGAWSESDLTRIGLPLELSFTSADAASLRFTVEASSPRLPARERLRLAVAMYEDVAPPLPQDVRAMLDRAPARSFGAWLGFRCDGARTAWKLYADTSQAPPRLSQLPVAARLMMSSYDGASDRVEHYFRAEAPGISGVLLLGRAFGLASETPDMLALLEEAVARPFRGELPSCDLGFSISTPRATDADVRLTLFGFAGSLFGGDSRCREAILRVASSHGWSFPLYELVSEPLRGRRGLAMHHCMFAVTAAAGAPPSISFGIAPPEDEP